MSLNLTPIYSKALSIDEFMSTKFCIASLSLRIKFSTCACMTDITSWGHHVKAAFQTLALTMALSEKKKFGVSTGFEPVASAFTLQYFEDPYMECRLIY